MKVFGHARNKPNQDDESPKAFLQQLASDRGGFLTEDEYHSWRSSVLERLEHPPRFDWCIVVPSFLALVVGVVFGVLGMVRWDTDIEEGGFRLLMGILLFGFGLYFVVGNVLACRAEFRKPQVDRMKELQEIFDADLIDRDEYDRIKAAIDSPTGRREKGMSS